MPRPAAIKLNREPFVTLRPTNCGGDWAGALLKLLSLGGGHLLAMVPSVDPESQVSEVAGTNKVTELPINIGISVESPDARMNVANH